MINYTFPETGRAIILIIITAWAALLSHKCISNFNDGIRPIFPELIEGRMSREDFAKTVIGMSAGWILAGFSHWLGYGLIACHFTLIATDCIGAKSTNKWMAIGLGALWGAICFYGTNGIQALFNSLPYNFTSDLINISKPVLPVLCLFPSVAIAEQYGPKKGIITGVIQVLVYIISILKSLNPYTFAMLAGIVCLIVFVVTDKNNVAIEMFEEEKQLFSKNINRIKSNWVYLCIQGGLTALGIATLAQAYQPEILSATVQEGDISIFIVAMIGVAFAFIPLAVSSALSTGVYQAIGIKTTVFVGALFYNSDYWYLAFVAGFIAEYIEIQSLEKIDNVLSKYPVWSQAGDHVRNAITSCITLALSVGSFVAGNAIWGITGMCIVGAFYSINEVTGRRIPKNAVGSVAAVVVGILYNIAILLGL